MKENTQVGNAAVEMIRNGSIQEELKTTKKQNKKNMDSSRKIWLELPVHDVTYILDCNKFCVILRLVF